MLSLLKTSPLTRFLERDLIIFCNIEMSKTQKQKDEIAKKIKKKQKVFHKGTIKQTLVSKNKSLSQNMK